MEMEGDSGDSSDLEPEKLIDGKSSKFNPEIALVCEEKALKLSQEAPVFLNIFELEKAIPDPRKPPVKGSSLEKVKSAKAKTTEKNSTAPVPSTAAAASSSSAETKTPADAAPTSSQPFYPMPGRKFLPHQMPVYRPPKEHPNVLKVMDTVDGPLAALREAMKFKRRVKVWTRGVTGIRGCLTGFVQAFDRHWNLALWDVHEIFQRRRCEMKGSKKSQDEDSEKTRTSKSITCKEMASKNEEAILVNSSDALVIFRLHMNALTRTKETKSDSVKLSSAEPHTASQLRKKRLTIFEEPFKDPFGFLVIAQSKNYEIVKRTRRKLLLVGNEVAFVETNPKWS